MEARTTDRGIRDQGILHSSGNTTRRKPVPSRIEITSDTFFPYRERAAFPPATTFVASTPPTRAPSPPPAPPTAGTNALLDSDSDQALLLSTASAARWRRNETNPHNRRKPQIERLHVRANSELVLQVKVMEEVHGVDVSWLHHPNKGIERYRAVSRAHTNSTVDRTPEASLA